MNEPTHISCVDGHQKNALDLSLISNPNKYEVKASIHLGNSDHCTISASFPVSRLREISPAVMKLR